MQETAGREAQDEDDAKLMRAVAAGDDAAFSRLVRRHLPATLRLAARILGPGLAEDAAQEAFIRVWRHAGRFADPRERGAKFTTWLYRITVNLCIDEKRKFRPVSLDDVSEPVSHAATPEESLHGREQALRLRRALDALPARQRAAFILCFHEGHSNAAAAEMMGLSVKALESLLVRARRTLRETLKDERGAGS